MVTHYLLRDSLQIVARNIVGCSLEYELAYKCVLLRCELCLPFQTLLPAALLPEQL